MLLESLSLKGLSELGVAPSGSSIVADLPGKSYAGRQGAVEFRIG
jgi:hypothetical protein